MLSDTPQEREHRARLERAAEDAQQYEREREQASYVAPREREDAELARWLDENRRSREIGYAAEQLVFDHVRAAVEALAELGVTGHAAWDLERSLLSACAQEARRCAR